MGKRKDIKKLQERVDSLEFQAKRHQLNIEGVKLNIEGVMGWVEGLTDRTDKALESFKEFMKTHEGSLDELKEVLNDKWGNVPAVLSETEDAISKRDALKFLKEDMDLLFSNLSVIDYRFRILENNGQHVDCSCRPCRATKNWKERDRKACKRKVWDKDYKPKGSKVVSEEKKSDWPAPGAYYYYINIYSKSLYGISKEQFNHTMEKDGTYITPGEKVLLDHNMLFETEEVLKETFGLE